MSSLHLHSAPVSLLLGEMLASHSPLLHLCPQFISQFEEEIPILKAEVGRLKVQVQEPRETVFADVLLRRPKYVIFLAAVSQTRHAVCLKRLSVPGEGRALHRGPGRPGSRLASPLQLAAWQM